MTDYTILSNTAVGVGGLPSGATVTALRDNPIAIAEGTAGSPPIVGVKRLISTTVVTTSVASVDFFFDPLLYETIFLEGQSIYPVSTVAAARLRLSADGSTFSSGSFDYDLAYIATNGGTLLSSAGGYNSVFPVINFRNSASRGMNFRTQVFGADDATQYTQCQTEMGGYSQVSSSQHCWAASNGQRLSNAITNGLQFSFQSSDTAKGIFKIYGVPKP